MNTLKQLAPYLPYGLKIKVGITDVAILTASTTTSDFIAIDYVVANDAYKPILRPLSDLTDAKIQEYFVGCDLDVIRNKEQIIINWSMYNQWKEERINLIVIDLLGQKERHLPMSASLYNWLLKHHFDVFGLIDKGLAIDVNTI